MAGRTQSGWVNFHQAVEEFKSRVPELARGLVEILTRSHQTNKAFQKAFAEFFELCRQTLNPNISQAAVDEMLVQHLLTERLIRKIFDNPEFTRRNVIAAEIEKVIAALVSLSFNRDDFLKSLDRFYRAIEDAAHTLEDFGEKQQFLNTVYERFFQGYSVKVADTRAIVYTPQAIVDFMCASVEEVLEKEFGLTRLVRRQHPRPLHRHRQPHRQPPPPHPEERPAAHVPRAALRQRGDALAIFALSSGGDHRLPRGRSRRFSEALQTMEISVPSTAGLYRQVLGSCWEQLDEAVQRLHGEGAVVRAAGTFKVQHGGNWLLRLLARLARLPAAGEAIEMRLIVTPLPHGEEWRRDFAGCPLVSTQWKLSDGLLAERMGPMEMRFRLSVLGGALHYETNGVALCLGRLRVPLPRWLAPCVAASETPAGNAGQTYVRVETRLPGLGLLIAYEGTVKKTTDDTDKGRARG